MTVEYIRYAIAGSESAEFISAYRQAGAVLARSAFCKGFEFAQCLEDPQRFIVRIAWTSVSDHLEKFRASGEFREFFALIKNYVKNIEEMRHYTVL